MVVDADASFEQIYSQKDSAINLKANLLQKMWAAKRIDKRLLEGDEVVGVGLPNHN